VAGAPYARHAVTLLALLLVGGAVVYAALSAVGSSPDASPATTAVSPVSDGGSYADADAVQRALDGAGLPCADFTSSPSGLDTVTSSGSCALAGQWIVLVYARHPGDEAAADAARRAAAAGYPAWLYGRNWLVLFGYPADARKAADALGGVLVAS